MKLNKIPKINICLAILASGLSACSTVPNSAGPYGAYGGSTSVQGNALTRNILSTALNMGTSALSQNSSGWGAGAVSSIGSQLVSALTSQAPQYQYAAYQQPVPAYYSQSPYSNPPRYPSNYSGGAYAPQGQYYRGGYQQAPAYPNQWGY